MLRASFILALPVIMFLASCSVYSRGVQPDVPDRRVVLSSPHTDNGTDWTYGYSTMECPGGRPRFEGYPTSDVRRDKHSRLLFRVVVVPTDQAKAIPVRHARLRLTHRLYPSVAELTDDPAYTALTDSAGAAVLNVLPGLYRADVALIGFVDGTAVLRVRPRAADSVRVVLATAGIC